MSIIRVNKNKENPYVMLNKTALNDENISFKAKGLFAYLMSKPNNWCSNVEHLMTVSKDGRDSVRSALRELREHGYILKDKERNQDGTFTWYEIIFEEPQLEAKEKYKEQKIISSNAALKRLETIKNSKAQNETELKNEEENTPETENPLMDKIDPTINGLSVVGKPVDIINNEIINNYISSSSIKNDEVAIDNLDNSLVNLFNENICELKLTTEKKFIEITKELNDEFIIELINYCCEVNIKSFAGFNKILSSYLEKGITNKEDMILDIVKYRAERTQNSFKGNNKGNTPKTKNKGFKSQNNLKFNNFKAREYDYDDLEKKLLGWD